MSKRRFLPLGLAATVFAAVVTAAIVGSGAAAPTGAASFRAALVSDVGRFNDKGFNQNQLKGLNLAKRRLKIQTAVWPYCVVVPEVLGQQSAQLGFIPDQRPVQTLGPYRAHPALGVGVRARRPRWNLHHLDA